MNHTLNVTALLFWLSYFGKIALVSFEPSKYN